MFHWWIWMLIAVFFGGLIFRTKNNVLRGLLGLVVLFCLSGARRTRWRG